MRFLGTFLANPAEAPPGVVAHLGSEALDRAPVSFLDVATLNPITDLKLGDGAGQPGGVASGRSGGEVFTSHFSSYRDTTHWRASADGRVFGAWSTSHSPSGLFVLTLQGKTVRMSYEHDSTGHVIPGPDGRTIYTGSGGLFSDQLRAVRRGRADRRPLIPSADPNYYISVIAPTAEGMGPTRQARGAPRCSVYVAGNSSPIFTTDPLDEMESPARQEWQMRDAIADKRYHLLPAVKLLVTIPPSNDQVVLRRLDVLESLRKSGIDYLFVTSTPPRTASPREVMTYRLEARSSRGKPKFTLDSGPDGMSVTPDGELKWSVPADFAGDNPLTVIISVTDGSGQEAFHTFSLKIQ